MEEDTFLKFPSGFLWGAATSAHQIEGNTDNDWTVWEKSDQRLTQLKREGKNPSDFISGQVADHWSRYREDFDIAKELGHTIHRFSVEWSRIEPEEGKFDYEALQHYSDIVKVLEERGIEPMITLWHFTNPKWLSVKGGCLNEHFPELYKRFISLVVDNFKDRVHLWVTFNEALSVYPSLAYLRREWPPQKKNLFLWYKCRRNILRAHTLAYREIKNKFRDWSPATAPPNTSHNIKTQIGIVENIRPTIMPRGFGWVGRWFDKILYYRTLAGLLPYLDFIGLNYYTIRRMPGSTTAVPKQDSDNAMGWEVYPAGIYSCLVELKKLKKPIYITENGIADATDQKREKFIKEHLRWIWQAIRKGVDVRGYLYWSLLDNFEWAKGFKPRFGLIEIDYATQQRIIRPSAWAYAKIIKDNGSDFKI